MKRDEERSAARRVRESAASALTHRAMRGARSDIAYEKSRCDVHHAFTEVWYQQIVGGSMK